MTDPEPVLVLDEEVPDGPVDGRGGEAVHLALQHHVVTQRLHHAGAHGTDFRPEPYSSIIINTCCLLKNNFSSPDDEVGRHVDGGPHLVARLAHVLTPVCSLHAAESRNGRYIKSKNNIKFKFNAFHPTYVGRMKSLTL